VKKATKFGSCLWFAVDANVNDRQSKSDFSRRFWQEYKVASFEDPPRVATAIRK
jgi:hypothetical protein